MRQNRPSWFYFWGSPSEYRQDLRERSWKHNRSTQYKVIDMVKHVYKIRRRSDGLFSTGGTRPRWTTLGKVWSGRGHLKNHLRLAQTHKFASTLYVDCEVVEFAVTQPEINTTSIKDFLESS